MIVPFVTTSNEVANAIGGIHIGSPKAIRHITTDSRMLADQCLFIPLVGKHFDAHDFIADVCKSGKCAAYLTHKQEYSDTCSSDVSAILCNNTLEAYHALAHWHRKKFSLPVVAVTGTNGKTTTKEMVAHVLSSVSNCLKTQKNYNNEIGVPFTVLHLTSSHRYAVLEMGMNHSGEISRLSQCAKPTIAVITSIGEGHLEFLGTTLNVAHAKSEIFDGMDDGTVCIYNSDTKHTDIVHSKAQAKKMRIITFGTSGHIAPTKYQLFADKTEVEYASRIFAVHAYGLQNVYAILATIAVATALDIPLDLVQNALSTYEAVDMRGTISHGKCWIIDDSYNANPLSMEYALKSAVMVFPNKRKIAVLSDMKELGDSSRQYHYAVGEKVATLGFDLLYAWGIDARYYVEGAQSRGMNSRAKLWETKEELIRALFNIVQEDDVVLVKGSRSMKMEEVVHALKE